MHQRIVRSPGWVVARDRTFPLEVLREAPREPAPPAVLRRPVAQPAPIPRPVIAREPVSVTAPGQRPIALPFAPSDPSQSTLITPVSAAVTVGVTGTPNTLVSMTPANLFGGPRVNITNFTLNTMDAGTY